jgi:release factor glutamine methyltransferase
MRTLVRHIVAHTYKPLLERYLAHTRRYRYGGLVLDVPPQVFHPGFFGSTGLLLQQLKTLPVRGKRLLELGAGSGLLSMVAAQKGALVTATDINRTAIRFLLTNKKRNNLALTVIHSDLFEALPRQHFDYILINPPYYHKAPRTEKEYAWYCGESGEYFTTLFQHLAQYTHAQSEVYMTLCDGCAIDWIKEEATVHGWQLQEKRSKQNLVERHFLFYLQQAPSTQHHEH